MLDIRLLLIASMAFVSVFAVVVVVAGQARSRQDLKRRLSTNAPSAQVLEDRSRPSGGVTSFVEEHFTEERYGVDSALRQKLRLELVRAGFFSPVAVRYYVFFRLLSVIGLPMLGLVAFRLLAPEASNLMIILVVTLIAGLGIMMPDAVLSRMKETMMGQYRLIFPDLLDLVTVCVSAGLSVEAAFDRISGQIGKRNEALGHNISLMGAEVRAGRSLIDALNSFSERLGIDEAASFVAVLRHSVELGGDIASAMTAFSEDMRGKRMLLAERKANELPVKIVFPMALGIFPVILAIVLLPVMVKLLGALHQIN